MKLFLIISGVIVISWGISLMVEALTQWMKYELEKENK
jgi:hypothetical protein